MKRVMRTLRRGVVADPRRNNRMVLKERLRGLLILISFLAFLWSNSPVYSVSAADNPATGQPEGSANQGAQATAAPDRQADQGIELPPEIDLWSCCRDPSLSSAVPSDGMTMQETVYLVSIQTALQTVGDALPVQKNILSGKSVGGAKVRLKKLRKDLREARSDLAAQRKALTSDTCRDKDALIKSVKDAEQVVRADLHIQERILEGVNPYDARRLLKRLRLVDRRLDDALADCGKVLADGDTVTK